jgi:23S rRNA pseudouridine1911/1915/1917 synthase
MKIKVLFENTNLLVLDKPAGLAVHGDGKTKRETVVDFIFQKYKNIKGVGENMFVNIMEGKTERKVEIHRPGIVHRLDKDTSGVLIIAKTADAYENLKKQFQEHKIRKEYTAVLLGDVKFDTGIIDTPIARSKSDFRKKEVVKKVIGKDNEPLEDTNVRGGEREAMTRYKVGKKITLLGQKMSVVTFFPETGRMHQLRVHAKSIGHPIIGDHLYGPRNEELEEKVFGKSKSINKVRQLLHAKSVTFFNPGTGAELKVIAPLPKDFAFTKSK